MSEFLPYGDYSKNHHSRFRKIAASFPLFGEKNTIDALYAEQEITETRVAELGNPGLEAEAIPGVDEIFNFQPLNEGSGLRIIELNGVIGSGKDTISMAVPQEEWGVYCLEEAVGHMFRVDANFHRTPGAISKLLPGKEVRPHLEFMALMDLPFDSHNVGTIIENRGRIDDIVFARSKFLSRGIFPKEFYIDFLLDDAYEFYRPSAVFILMANPFVSLQRKLKQFGRSEKDYSALINPNFMITLYQQYLRLIAELREAEQPNLVVINANKPIGAVASGFLNSLSQILGTRV